MSTPVSPLAPGSNAPARPGALRTMLRSPLGLIGLAYLSLVLLACVATLPYTLGRAPVGGDGAASTSAPARFDAQDGQARHLPPSWWGVGEEGKDGSGGEGGDTAARRLREVSERRALEALARERGTTTAALIDEGVRPTAEQVAAAEPFYLMGTDVLGRDLTVRILAGGGISLGIGLAAAAISVFLGTMYGALAGYLGGRADALMMRVVDILYGLPYILLVVLLAVAVDARLDAWQASRARAAAEQREAWVQGQMAASREGAPARADADQLRAEAIERFGSGELSAGQVQAVNVVTLLVAIGGVSWLTMARVVRGQVLSLRGQPFMEAARALGVPAWRQFARHLLPNLVGPIIVYATLTVPQAILQESFLSFLGIGVRPPLPSWGTLAADGLTELNPYKSNWWLLLFPCVMLAMTLLALNFLGEALREAFDPKRGRR